jgi:hypothetical protein
MKSTFASQTFAAHTFGSATWSGGQRLYQPIPVPIDEDLYDPVTGPAVSVAMTAVAAPAAPTPFGVVA